MITIPGMDLTDRKLLNLLQSQFPLVDQPYQDMGQGLGIGETEVIERLGTLREKNVVRQITPSSIPAAWATAPAWWPWPSIPKLYTRGRYISTSIPG